MKTKQTNETVEEDLSSRRYYTNANISLKFIGLKQKPTPEYINFLNGEIAEWIKEVREKNTKIKQLQDEIGGYKINHSKMIKLINRAEKNQFNYEQEINDLGKEIVSLKQQLADIEKESNFVNVCIICNKEGFE